jgi:hypothetical protein
MNRRSSCQDEASPPHGKQITDTGFDCAAAAQFAIGSKRTRSQDAGRGNGPRARLSPNPAISPAGARLRRSPLGRGRRDTHNPVTTQNPNPATEGPSPSRRNPSPGNPIPGSRRAIRRSRPASRRHANRRQSRPMPAAKAAMKASRRPRHATEPISLLAAKPTAVSMDGAASRTQTDLSARIKTDRARDGPRSAHTYRLNGGFSAPSMI